VSALGSVLAEARVGGTAENIAARLGLARDLVDSMIDQGERLGLLGSAAAACGTCVGASADRLRERILGTKVPVRGPRCLGHWRACRPQLCPVKSWLRAPTWPAP